MATKSRRKPSANYNPQWLSSFPPYEFFVQTLAKGSRKRVNHLTLHYFEAVKIADDACAAGGKACIEEIFTWH